MKNSTKNLVEALDYCLRLKNFNSSQSCSGLEKKKYNNLYNEAVKSLESILIKRGDL